MSLIVEDGSIVTDANSFVSVADATDFWTLAAIPDLLTDWSALTVAQQESYLKQSTRSICRDFRFNGEVQDNSQVLCFPRVCLTDCQGRTISQGTMPEDLIEATIIYALFLAKQPPIDYMGIDSSESAQDDFGVKRVQDHDVEIVYFESRYFRPKPGIRSKYPERVFDLLKCYTETGSKETIGFVKTREDF